MCLGIPGQVVGWVAESDLLARVEVTGVARTINIGLLQEPPLQLGDWVLIHVGFAMERITEDDAACALDGLALLGRQAEAPSPSMPAASPD